MKTLFIILAVIFCISIISNQVMYRIAERKRNPEGYLWGVVIGTVITYIISAIGWVACFTVDIQAVKPLLWCMFVSSVIVLLVGHLKRSDRNPVPGIVLCAVNLIVTIFGLCLI